VRIEGGIIMNVMDAILSRRSVRKYTSQEVSDDVIKELLEAGMSAPSAENERPWHFIVIRDRKILDEIAKFRSGSGMLKDAPMAVLVCGDSKLDIHKGCLVQDCSAATENILIAVQGKRLGAVWLDIYSRRDWITATQKLLDIPEHVIPISLIPIGYPAEKKPQANRYDASRVHYEHW